MVLVYISAHNLWYDIDDTQILLHDYVEVI